jgi:murein DD-endopeptidase MepM/ murein hydrolase activator NlpD
MKAILYIIALCFFAKAKGQTSWVNKEYVVKIGNKKEQPEQPGVKEKVKETKIVKRPKSVANQEEFFINPINPKDWKRISSGYGTRTHPILKTVKHHTGIDIPAPKGTPVYAVLSGVIEVLTSDDINGNYIKINHQNGYMTAYCHLSAFNVKKGEFVNRGQIIGFVGSTGRATGAHLHYEVRLNSIRQDPNKYLLFK